MNQKKILIFFFIIFLLNFISAITIYENTQFQPSDTNTTFIIGNNLSFDLAKIYSTYFKLDNNTIFANASIGSVNITILNFTNSYKKWNESKSDSSATINYVLSNFSDGVSVLIKKNNVAWKAVISNSTGYINFEYFGDPALFEAELGSMPSTSTQDTTTSSSGGGYPNYKPTRKQLKKGYEKTLRKNYKISFNYNNKAHLIKLKNIINKTAIITVSSKPQTFNLNINETKKLKLEEGDYYNLQIFLKDIHGAYADLVIKLIHEKISSEKTNTEKKKEIKQREEKIKTKSNLWIWLVVGLILLLFIAVSVKYKKKIFIATINKTSRKNRLIE